jgi:heptosyltransferase II
MEPRAIKPWPFQHQPQSILATRLQALGDTVITLPYLQSLREKLPHTQIDFLTREEVADIPQKLDLFDHVFVIDGGRNVDLQFQSAQLLLPHLKRQGYDVVIDLQRNDLTRFIRQALQPVCYSEFDRFSPQAAGERTRLTIEATGLGPVGINSRFKLKDPALGINVLRHHGWRTDCDLVVLNPAGLFVTRHWPLENYVEFAHLWLKQHNPRTQFVMVGLGEMADRARILQKELGHALLNLVDQTTAAEAFAIIQHATLVLSEDSGLMHMAWVSGRPTLALFGSTRSDWARPLGEYALYLDSSDLACGHCMQATCQFGDVRCLTRYSPTFVFEHARSLLRRLGQRAESA